MQPGDGVFPFSSAGQQVKVLGVRVTVGKVSDSRPMSCNGAFEGGQAEAFELV
jgi:hypothetical protein